MCRPIRKFVAMLLAVWLPLFSGNVLAVSVAMQSQRGDCQTVVVQQGEHHAAPTHHAQPAANQDKSAEQQDHQNTSCKNCSVCHFACSGYMATTAIKVAADQPLAPSFAPASTQFQSITSAPLDPPPLARV